MLLYLFPFLSPSSCQTPAGREGGTRKEWVRFRQLGGLSLYSFRLLHIDNYLPSGWLVHILHAKEDMAMGAGGCNRVSLRPSRTDLEFKLLYHVARHGFFPTSFGPMTHPHAGRLSLPFLRVLGN